MITSSVLPGVNTRTRSVVVIGGPSFPFGSVIGIVTWCSSYWELGGVSTKSILGIGRIVIVSAKETGANRVDANTAIMRVASVVSQRMQDCNIGSEQLAEVVHNRCGCFVCSCAISAMRMMYP